MDNQVHVDDETFDDRITKALVGRKIVSVSSSNRGIYDQDVDGELVLDDGTVLEIQCDYADYDGGDGDFFIDALNTVDNAIMSVSLNSTNKGEIRHLKLFVYTEGMASNGQMVAAVHGAENEYYGTGFNVSVKVPS